MQIKSVLTLAAIALTANAAEPLNAARNGPLDFSKSGGVAVAKRGAPQTNQAADGGVAIGGAMDFGKGHRDSKRAAENCTEEAAKTTGYPSWAAGTSGWAHFTGSGYPHPSGSHSVRPSGASSVVIPTGKVQAVSSEAPGIPVIVGGSIMEISSEPTVVSKPQVSTPAAAHTSVPAPVVTTAKAPATTAAPAIQGSGTHGPLTFVINNSMGGSISISYQLGTYSPATGGPTTVASSLVGPSATTGVFAAATTVVAPVGWAGRMTIGKAGAALDYRGTKIEGNNGFDGADPKADPDPDIDVSYVDGYSVPAVCSCGAVALSGCNKELFDLGNKCPELAGDAQHQVCVNDPAVRKIHGPADPFFQPCHAAAYTYDYDDVANWQGSCPGNTITCCIGTNCPAPTRQPAGNSKREVMALIAAKKRRAAEISY